jgi:metallo-beta-lactamase family protein
MISHLADRSSPPTVTFWGAARTVTGSMHLVAFGGRNLLLDCGAHRGPHDHGHWRNRGFPFHAYDMDGVVLSHAHSDHCGNLPVLVRHGFTGPIYCTAATRDLLAVMLGDSARIQEADSRVLRILERDRDGSGQPLFSREDVASVLRQCVVIPYESPREVLPGVQLRLFDAGHLLGAAMVSLMFENGGRESSLTFTGDLGRRGLPLVHDPSPVPLADLLICECTYGGKTHQPMHDLRATLTQVVKRTAERGGKVLIPAFSLGRTQAVVHSLQQEMQAGRLPDVPIFVDSPLAADVADVYRRHCEELGEPMEALAFGSDVARDDLDFLDGGRVHYVRDAAESRELSTRREPYVLVASGGMCEGGRIVHHLKQHIDDPRCSVVLVSYQAPGTPGRQLLERGPKVRLHGRSLNKWADVIDLNGFSGHADHNDLLELLAPLAGRVERVCLVHGEPERAEALRQALVDGGFKDVLIPAEGQQVSLACED